MTTKPLNASEIRQKYLDFQVKKGHKVIAPAPLVLENDPTTLFTGAGMQPLLPYLLGETHPEGKRLTDSQPCLRLQDIEDVGDPRHTTIFEMLGNWSLGDYFKEEQITNYFEFLTEEIGLDPEKIYVTCFIGSEKYGLEKDLETAKIWQKVFRHRGIDAKIAEIGSAENGAKRGIKPGERIFFYDDQENWWSRGGGCDSTPVGDPCGPDSEVFYDFGEDKQNEQKFGKSHPASDGTRFMEIGNQVFMQYRRTEDGFEELEKKNVDFGGGLERLAAAKMGSFDVFQISLLKPIIEKIEQISGKSYETNTDEMRIIADHLRGAYLLAAQGLTPSNKAQGYAMRRLIRRAILRALDLGIAQDFLKDTISPIESEYTSLTDTILTNRKNALEILEKEERAFRSTLNRGLKELHKLVSKTGEANASSDSAEPSTVSGMLLSDFSGPDGARQRESERGSPVATTQANERTRSSLLVPSRAVASLKKTGRADACRESDKSIPPAILTGYDLFKLQDTYGFPHEISIEQAYKEGIELSANWHTEFDEALEKQRNRSKTASKGMFKGGLENHSEMSTKYHTATHLLLAAIQKHINKDATQKGSNITEDRMRLDFDVDHKLTPEEKQTLEDQVNAWIKQDLKVTFSEYDKNYAKNELKAHGSFWERYPDTVKVYTIGDEAAPVSSEVCGGPHVETTGTLGHFKIKKEESSSAGVRRIKAILE